MGIKGPCPAGLQTGFRSTSINTGDLGSKPLFKTAGDAAVLELMHLDGTAGLKVGCDPIMVLEQHVRGLVFAEGRGLDGCK